MAQEAGHGHDVADLATATSPRATWVRGKNSGVVQGSVGQWPTAADLPSPTAWPRASILRPVVVTAHTGADSRDRVMSTNFKARETTNQA
jgi:hypothetical protein